MSKSEEPVEPIMVMSSYQKQRILVLRSKGFKAPSIVKVLKKEGISVSRFGVHKFLQHFDESGCLLRKPGSQRPSKLTLEVKRVVEDQMRLDDETTAFQLHSILTAKGYDLSLFLLTPTVQYTCTSSLSFIPV